MKKVAVHLCFALVHLVVSTAFTLRDQPSPRRTGVPSPLALSTRVTSAPGELLGTEERPSALEYISPPRIREDSSLLSDEAIPSSSATTEPRKFTPLQQGMRALPLVTGISYIIDPKPLDGMVQTLWNLVYSWDVAQNPLFEAEVASAGFFLWISMFSCLHLFLGEDQTKANRLDGEMPHDPFEWTRFENWHLWFNPLASYLGSIWLWLQIHEKPPMPIEAPSFGVLTIELLFGIWLYDLCFFPIHYAMHRHELGKMRKVHGYHHRSGKTTMNALETVQHSYIDGFLQVFVNIVVQQISPFGGPKHVFSRLLHNLTVT